MSAEKSCPKRKEWDEAIDVHCISCGEELFKKERLVKENLDALQDSFKLPLIKINPIDGYLIVLGKRIIQFIQIVFFGILSLLIWIASVLQVNPLTTNIS